MAVSFSQENGKAMIRPETKELLRALADPWPETKPDICPSTSAWFHAAHKRVFTRLLNKHPEGLYLEIGTWTGSGSTKFVADRFPAMSLICIDTFKGSVEHQRKDVWAKIAANLWEHFCGNHWENKERIYPMKSTSVLAMEKLALHGIAPDFVYIDGAHDADSVYADVATAVELFPKAIIIGDDYTLPGKGYQGIYTGLRRAIVNNVFPESEFKNDKRVWWLTRNTRILKG